jgi:hypothetical protein
MVGRVATFVTYCFEIPLTAADRDRFRAILVGEWRRKDRAANEGDLRMLATAEQLAGLDPAERELFRKASLRTVWWTHASGPRTTRTCAGWCRATNRSTARSRRASRP